MCGRFTLAEDPSEAGEEFQGFEFPQQFASRFNIAPSQPVLAIRNDGRRAADFLVWGLIPSWAKDPTIGSRLINARGETLAEKPAFRNAYKHKRCLIPADGFYEWRSQAGAKLKVPYYIQLKSRRPFAFAGLWDEWRSGDGSIVQTCAVITTSPNELMATIHNRMPVILQANDFAEWLDQAPRPPDTLNHLIRPLPAEIMQAFPVSTIVNSPSNDTPECIAPV
jgi:putative SOS response-associated peptidase YedK